MTTYPETTQPDLLTSAALDARSRRALALVRALRSIARNHGHAEHAAAVLPITSDAGGRAGIDERAWHEASIRCYRLLLACLGISDTADDGEDAEAAYQEVLRELFGDGEGSEGDRV